VVAEAERVPPAGQLEASSDPGVVATEQPCDERPRAEETSLHGACISPRRGPKTFAPCYERKLASRIQTT
jgi:hypothetical protein